MGRRSKAEAISDGLQVTYEMIQEEHAAPEPLVPTSDAIKAEDWQREDHALPWQNDVRCRECNTPMWVREPDKHDICENCGWLLREQIQELHTQQRAQLSDRFVNPFMGSDLWGQTGSLPSPEAKK